MLLTEKLKMELLEEARKAAGKAYAPYSNFRVGAALLTEEFEIITGCNIENLSYGLCICAERVAISKGISEGHTKFLVIAIHGGPDGSAFPCGACRQFMSEFMEPSTKILIKDKEYKLKDFFPNPLNFELKAPNFIQAEDDDIFH